MKKLVIILDPAHGEETAGKRSPDNKFREYKWSREICIKLEAALKLSGFDVEWTTMRDNEPGLSYRKNYATNLEVLEGQTKFLLSMHNNAAGTGLNWMSARGYEAYAYNETGTSAQMGKIILQSIQEYFPNLKMRPGATSNLVKSANLTVLMGSGYNGILFEWLFMDNKEDVALLEDENTNAKLVEALVKAMESINATL